MNDFFDNLQIILWSCVYLLSVFFTYRNFKDKRQSIPLKAVILNFSWELNALIVSRGFWGHIVWLSLDVLILGYGLYSLKKRKRFYYIIALLLSFLILNFSFLVLAKMLISVFIIDLLMALFFLLERKELQKKGRILIAVFKLFGDLAAGIYYSPFHVLVFIIAIIVLITNSIYLFFCIREWFQKQKEDSYVLRN